MKKSYHKWSEQLGHAYRSGSNSFFVLHGDVFDLFRSKEDGGETKYVHLQEYLQKQVFGKWDLVISYNMSRGLRPLCGAELFLKIFGDDAIRDPLNFFIKFDKFLEKTLRSDDDPIKVALVIEHAQYLVPAAGITTRESGTNLVTLINWASNPYLKKINVAFVLVTEKLSEIDHRIIRNPHVLSIEIPFPDERQRGDYLEVLKHDVFKTMSKEDLAKGSAGLTLLNLDMLVSRSKAKEDLDAIEFKKFKKEAIERECQGLVEFIEPDCNLDMIVGHERAVRRLKEDGDLLSHGHFDAVPMGYLFCGAVGTGKTFLVICFAGSTGIPVVKLKNFRSKYVGETEGNIEKALKVLRATGPVAVVIDEADAAVGNRSQDGDSGVSSRVFSMLSAQMGDTRYRGKIVWFLLTCRPDFLPIDIKRQGRAEVHIPLFYPSKPEEIEEMFRVQADRIGATIEKAPKIPKGMNLSGADIESIVTNARRLSAIKNRSGIVDADLQECIDCFIPATNGGEKRVQELAALLECTDINFLPEDKKKGFLKGREKLMREFEALQGV